MKMLYALLLLLIFSFNNCALYVPVMSGLGLMKRPMSVAEEVELICHWMETLYLGVQSMENNGEKFVVSSDVILLDYINSCYINKYKEYSE
jgi:hypothetical protein